MKPRLVQAVLAVTLLTAGLPVASAEDGGSARGVEEILASLGGEPGARRAEVTRRLEALGPGSLPALLDAYWSEAGRRPPARVAAAPVTTPHDILGEVIAGHRSEDLLRSLERRLEAHPGTPSRLLALRTLARFGDASALTFAVRVAAGIEPTALRSPSVTSAWKAALRRLLSDEGSRGAPLRTWKRVPVALRPPLCRVLVEQRTRTDLSLVLDLVVHGGTESPAMLWELGRGSPVVLHQLEVHARVKHLLADGDATVRAAVAALFAHLRDPDAVPGLARALDDPDRRVQRAAAAALQASTGVAHGRHRDRWRAWHDAELLWSRQSDLATRLRAPQPAEVSRALRELSQHRLMGATHAAAVEGLLSHDQAGIRLLACATLRVLGRADVAPRLVEHLSDPVPNVRRAVWQTLRDLSGEDHPLDPGVWAEAARRWRS